MANKARLGSISLWCAALGIILPACYVALDLTVIEKSLSERTAWAGFFGLIISGWVGAIMELIALVCGVMARRTALGKAGLAISAFSWLAVLCFFVVAWIRFGG